MLRRIGGVIVGLVVVVVVVLVLQMVGLRLHPPPEGIDPMDPADRDALLQFLASLPFAAWLHVFATEILGAFLGALAAGWIARDGLRPVTGTVMVLALCGSVYNWVSFPHPVWFMVGQVVAYPLALLLVWRILERRSRSSAQAAPVG